MFWIGPRREEYGSAGGNCSTVGPYHGDGVSFDHQDGSELGGWAGCEVIGT